MSGSSMLNLWLDNGSQIYSKNLDRNFGFNINDPVSRLHAKAGLIIIDEEGIFADTKYNSQGVAWSGISDYAGYILQGGATHRPEISYYRGSREYPEFSIREHTTSDTGGEIYAGNGQVAPTKVMEFDNAGVGITGDLSVSGVLSTDSMFSVTNMIVSTFFETSGRFTAFVNNSGTNTFGTEGVVCETGITGTSSARIDLRATVNSSGFAGMKGSMGCFFSSNTLASDGASEVVTGNGFGDGTSISTTRDQYGVYIDWSDNSIYATNSQGTAETATDIGTISVNVGYYFVAVNNGINIKYYLDGTLVATHTTNLPDLTQSDNVIQVISSNETTTQNAKINVAYAFMAFDI